MAICVMRRSDTKKTVTVSNVVRERIKYPDVELSQAEKEKICEQQKAVYELEAKILGMFGITCK